MHIGDVPRRNAFRYPNGVAWQSEDGCWTWPQANERINRLANALLALGLRKGDRIGVLGFPSHHVAEAYFAAAKVGLVVVPIVTGQQRHEVEFILRDVGARAVMVEAACRDSVAPFVDRLPALQHVIGFGPDHGLPLDHEELLRRASADEPDIAVEENDLYAIRFTSGTTGLPKGCPFRHRDVLNRSIHFLAHIAHSHRDRALMLSPLSLGVGMSMWTSYSYVGCAMYFIRRFDPGQILALIEAERITTFMMPVPSLFAGLLEHESFGQRDLSSLRVVGYGGAVFPIPLLKRSLAAFPCDFFGIYGQMEAGGFSTYLMPEDHRLTGCTGPELEQRERRLSSCGREALQADVRIWDAEGRELPPGQVGEMVVSTAGMVQDYWNRPGEIGKIRSGRWLRTGDAAWMDADGYIYIVDRIKDLVRTGGMNVSSVEVEEVLRQHPGVQEAAIVGIPDPRWGEAVTAFVVLRPDQAASEGDLVAFCRSHLAGYKVPKQVEFVRALPVNTMNKVLKRELKEIYRKRHPQPHGPEAGG